MLGADNQTLDFDSICRFGQTDKRGGIFPVQDLCRQNEA
jgi:hypothetical protein